MSEPIVIKGTITHHKPGAKENQPHQIAIKDESGETKKFKVWGKTWEQFSLNETGEFTFEPKDGYNGTEYFLAPKEKPKGRGGGVAKSDPVKNQNIKDCNTNNNDTMRTASALKNATEYQRMAMDYLLQQQTVHGTIFTVNDVQATAIELQKGGQNLADMIMGRFS